MNPGRLIVHHAVAIPSKHLTYSNLSNAVGGSYTIISSLGHVWLFYFGGGWGFVSEQWWGMEAGEAFPYVPTCRV